MPRILIGTMSYWNSQAQFDEAYAGPLGLKAWYDRVQHLLRPSKTFLVSGTWSPPAMSRFGRLVEVVNGGAINEGGYDVLRRNYSGSAFTAALSWALNQPPEFWDLLIIFDSSALIGDVDFDAILREFMGRPEIHMNQWWYGTAGGPLWVWKREGASWWLNHRQRANFIAPGGPDPITLEEENTRIFAGKWWNSHPDWPTLRQDYGFVADAEKYDGEAWTWPFCRFPSPTTMAKWPDDSVSKPLRPD